MLNSAISNNIICVEEVSCVGCLVFVQHPYIGLGSNYNLVFIVKKVTSIQNRTLFVFYPLASLLTYRAQQSTSVREISQVLIVTER